MVIANYFSYYFVVCLFIFIFTELFTPPERSIRAKKHLLNIL